MSSRNTSTPFGKGPLFVALGLLVVLPLSTDVALGDLDGVAIAGAMAGTALVATCAPAPPQMTEKANQQILALQVEKEARSPAQQKLSSELLQAMTRYRGDTAPKGHPQLRSSVTVEQDGTTMVDIKAEVTEGVLAQIEALGGTVMNQVPKYQAIRARMPMENLEALAAFPQVTFIRAASQARTRDGTTSP